MIIPNTGDNEVSKDAKLRIIDPGIDSSELSERRLSMRDLETRQRTSMLQTRTSLLGSKTLHDPDTQSNDLSPSLRDLDSPTSASENLELRYRRPSIRDLGTRQRTSMLQTRTSLLAPKTTSSTSLDYDGRQSALDKLQIKYSSGFIPSTEMVVEPGENVPCKNEKRHFKQEMVVERGENVGSKNEQRRFKEEMVVETGENVTSKNEQRHFKQEMGSELVNEVDSGDLDSRESIEVSLEKLVMIKRKKNAKVAEEKRKESGRIDDSIVVGVEESGVDNVVDADTRIDVVDSNVIEINLPKYVDPISTLVEPKRTKTTFSTVMATITKQKPTADEIRNHRLHR
jgi:hypothetical protein